MNNFVKRNAVRGCVACLLLWGAGHAGATPERQQHDLICTLYNEGADRKAVLAEAGKYLEEHPVVKESRFNRSNSGRYRADVEYIRAVCMGDTVEAVDAFSRIAAVNRGTTLGISALYMAGQCRYNRREYGEALKIFSEIAECYPKHFLAKEGFYGLLQTQIALNDRTGADATLARLLKVDPSCEKQPKILFASGLLLYHKQQYDLAAEKFSRLDTAPALYFAGRCLEKTGKYVQAVAACRQLLTRYPDSEFREEAWFRMAASFYHAGDYVSALDEFRSFVSAFPQSRFAELSRYRLGCCHFRKKEYPDAIVVFKNLLADFPGGEFSAFAQYMIGEAYLAQGNLGEAITAYGTVINTYPESEVAPEACYKSGWCYTAQNCPDPAIAILNRYVAQFPRHEHVPHALLLLGENNRRGGADAQAVASYRQVLERADAGGDLSEAALFMIARTGYEAKRYGDVISNSHFILNRTAASSAEWRGLTYLLLGDSYFHQGMYTEAGKMYDLVVQNYPYGRQAALAQDGKAWVYARTGQYDLALKERQAYIDDTSVEHSAEEKISSEFETGNIYFNQKKYLEALDVFEKFVTDYPRDPLVPEALFNIGRCYYKLEYYTRAIQSWEKLVAGYRDHARTREAMNLVADTYFRAQKYPEAIGAYRRIGTAYPDADIARQAQLRIAQSHYNAGELQQAVGEYEKFLDRWPDDPAAESAVEGIATAAGRISEKGGGSELQLLRRFVAKYPKSRFAGRMQYRIAECCYEKKDYAVAAEEFRRVFASYADDERVPDARFYMAESLYLAGRYEESVAAYRCYIDNYPRHESLRIGRLHLANALFHMEKFPEAARAYDDLVRASAINDNDEVTVTALLNEALCCKKAGKWSDAVLAYEQFAKRYPDNKLTRDVLAELSAAYEKLKQYDQAASACQRLLQALAADDPSRAEMQYKVADYCLKQDRPQQGIDELQKLFAIQPAGDPWRLSGLARLAQEYENLKQWDKAVEAYNEIMRSAKEKKWIDAARERLKVIETANKK